MFTGPSRSILARSAAIASSALTVPLLGGAMRSVGSPRRRPAIMRRRALSPRSIVQFAAWSHDASASGTRRSSRSSASTSRITSSSVACTASSHVCARCDRSASAVARAMSSSGDDRADRSRARRAPLIEQLVLVGLGAKRATRLRPPRSTCPAAGRRARARRRRVAPRRPRSRRERPSICAVRTARARRTSACGALFELERRLLRAAALRRRARSPARRARVRGCASAARRLSSSVASRASNTTALRRRQPLVGGSADPLRAARSTSRASSWRRSSASRSSSRLPPLARQAARPFCASRICFVVRVLQLRVVADDGFFLLVMLGVQRGDRRSTPARSSPRAARSPRPRSDERRRAPPAMRPRRSLISRLVSRMPRAPARLPPGNERADRGTRRRQRSPPAAASARGCSAAPHRRSAAIHASPIAQRIASDERAVDADDRRQRDDDRPARRRQVGFARISGIGGDSPSAAMRKPQRPASASRTSWNPAAACSGLLDDDVLQHDRRDRPRPRARSRLRLRGSRRWRRCWLTVPLACTATARAASP